jgi:hypothetical protein
MKKVRALWSYVAHVLSPCRRNTNKLSGLLLLFFDIFLLLSMFYCVGLIFSRFVSWYLWWREGSPLEEGAISILQHYTSSIQ